MAPRPFGTVTASHQRRQRTRAEHEALDRLEAERQAGKWELEQFFSAQKKRIAQSLTRSVNRIHDARWGTSDTDSTQLLVSRKSPVFRNRGGS